MNNSNLLKQLQQEAKTAGNTYYAVGIPCAYGHTGGRFTAGGACCECHRARCKKRYETNKETVLANSAKRWLKNYPVPVQPARTELKKLRNAAKEAGKTRYAIGIPCKHGHLSGRLVCSGVCVECSASGIKKWAAANPDSIKLASKRYREANPNQAKASVKKWGKKNKAVIAAHGANRRRREKQSTLKGPWTQELNAIYDQCTRLSEWIGIKYHVDHIVPIVHPDVCGLHVPWNLQIIPMWHNLEKGNKFVCG